MKKSTALRIGSPHPGARIHGQPLVPWLYSPQVAELKAIPAENT